MFSKINRRIGSETKNKLMKRIIYINTETVHPSLALIMKRKKKMGKKCEWV
jgi:hypothetical protein